MLERNSKAPVRVDPFSDLGFWGRGARSPFRLSRLLSDELGEEEGRLWSPAVDVTESEKSYSVTVELAGAKREDVTVESHEGMLSIKGEKKSERNEEDEHHHYVERRYGSFSRSFRLPSDAAEGEVKASFRDGVLTVEIPKVEQRQPKAVSITT
jgi:HSP20 family protein